jgi:hypothetical protein
MIIIALSGNPYSNLKDVERSAPILVIIVVAFTTIVDDYIFALLQLLNCWMRYSRPIAVALDNDILIGRRL